jgi:hypothetical protein
MPQVYAHLGFWVRIERTLSEQVADVGIARRLGGAKQAGRIGAPVWAARVSVTFQEGTGLVENDDEGGPGPIGQGIDAIEAPPVLG